MPLKLVFGPDVLNADTSQSGLFTGKFTALEGSLAGFEFVQKAGKGVEARIGLVQNQVANRYLKSDIAAAGRLPDKCFGHRVVEIFKARNFVTALQLQ